MEEEGKNGEKGKKKKTLREGEKQLTMEGKTIKGGKTMEGKPMKGE